jgi:hypothetical protein
VRPEGLLRSLDQVRPFITSVAVAESANQQWKASIGDWNGSEVQAFLFEVVVPPLAVGDHHLMKIALEYDMPGANLKDQLREEIVKIRIRPAAQVAYQVDSTVKHWLERLVAYRLQARAWKDVEAGKIEEAAQGLKMAGTRLFAVGEQALAQTVQEEAGRLQHSGSTSDEGRKRIKFGTRGLMGAAEEQAAGA